MQASYLAVLAARARWVRGAWSGGGQGRRYAVCVALWATLTLSTGGCACAQVEGFVAGHRSAGSWCVAWLVGVVRHLVLGGASLACADQFVAAETVGREPICSMLLRQPVADRAVTAPAVVASLVQSHSGFPLFCGVVGGGGRPKREPDRPPPASARVRLHALKSDSRAERIADPVAPRESSCGDLVGAHDRIKPSRAGSARERIVRGEGRVPAE